MDKSERRAAIEAAEMAVGSKLPDKLRKLLEDKGEVWFDTPEGVGADPVFRLSSTATGTAIFADQQGMGISELSGWDDDAEGWEFTKGAFLALDNQCGDTVLLAPDERGVARKFVFCNHETYELELWSANVEEMLVHPDESSQVNADELDGSLPMSPLQAAIHAAIRSADGRGDISYEQLISLLEKEQLSTVDIESTLELVKEFGIKIYKEK